MHFDPCLLLCDTHENTNPLLLSHSRNLNVQWNLCIKDHEILYRGVLYSEVKLYTRVVTTDWNFIEKCPLFGVSFIRGSTVQTPALPRNTHRAEYNVLINSHKAQQSLPGEGVTIFTLSFFVPLIQLSSEDGGRDGWQSVSCPNGLADVHWLHVGSRYGSSRIDKEKREVFVKGRIQDVRKHFQVISLFLCVRVFLFWVFAFMYIHKRQCI